MPESSISLDLPPPAWWRLGPGLWFASALTLIVVYLMFNLPGSWFGGGTPQNFPGAAININAGTGQTEGDKLVITSPDPKNAIVLTLKTPSIPTQQYGLLALDVDGIPDESDVTLFWSNDFAPTKVFTRTLTVAGGHLQNAMLAGDSNWLGRVYTIGLVVRANLAQPLTIKSIAFKPATAASILAERWHDWFDPEGWSGISLSRIIGGRAGMDLPLPLLTGLATALAGGLYWGLRRWRRWAPSALTIAAIVMPGWLLLDLRWQWNLGVDTLTSWNNFAGQELSAKRLAGADAEFEKIAVDIRPLLTAESRLFIFAQDPGIAGRLAYLLLPAKIYFDINQAALPPPDRFKAGDLVLIHRKTGFPYSRERKEFLWDNKYRLGAEVLYQKRDTVLARIL